MAILEDKPQLHTLEILLAAGQPVMIQQAHELIKQFKMPYVIEKGDDGKYHILSVGTSTDAWLARYITTDTETDKVKEKVRILAKVDDDRDQLFCCLIIGNTGTGKEILARALHGERAHDFVAINCAGMPENLIESELFGHVRGAFTGADTNKEGLMKTAETLFLDELGELPMPAQAKLLRAVQSKKIRKVGANKEEDISCRIVAATHRDLAEMVNEHRFRMDLYARLSTYQLNLKPLHRRTGDIEPILLSMNGGKAFIEALWKQYPNYENIAEIFTWLNNVTKGYVLQFNVRSLQQHVKRFKLFGELP